MNKQKKDNMVYSVLEIPRNRVKPVNRRIFAITQDPGEMKTGGGIIVPTEFSMPEAKNGIKKELMRFYVVDVADDVTIEIGGRKLKRGDEIFPFIPQEAIAWSFPVVYDFYINKSYLVIEQSELAGVGMLSDEEMAQIERDRFEANWGFLTKKEKQLQDELQTELEEEERKKKASDPFKEE